MPIILSYFENNTSVLSDISQSKISYNDFKFLIGNLFAKIKDLPGLIHIYSVLMKMKNLKEDQKKVIANEVKNIFSSLLLKGVDTAQLDSHLLQILKIISENKLEFNDKFLKELETSLDSTIVIDYYKRFVSSEIAYGAFENIINAITSFLVTKVIEQVNSVDNISSDNSKTSAHKSAEALYEIKKLFPNKKLKPFLDCINEPYELKESDLLLPKDNTNLLLWNYFMKDNTIINYKSHNYIYKGTSNMKKLYTKLTKKTFKFDYINQLNQIKSILKNRLEAILYQNEKNQDALINLYNDLVTNIEQFLNYKKYIDVTVNYVNVFEHSIPARVEHANQLYQNLISKEIKDLLPQKDEYENLKAFQKEYELCLSYTTSSSFFMALVNHYNQKLHYNAEDSKKKQWKI